MTTKHTPGPWRAHIAGQHSWQVLAQRQPGILGARFVVSHASREDAERIVACVNACEGLTEAELGRFIDVATALRTENARLRAALEKSADLMGAYIADDTCGTMLRGMAEQARAALKGAE